MDGGTWDCRMRLDPDATPSDVAWLQGYLSGKNTHPPRTVGFDRRPLPRVLGGS